MSEEGDDGKVEFLVPFYFAEKLRTAVATGDFSYSSRARRLAQEIASLSTSLPLSFSSSVFLRCDENRLDLMKVRSRCDSALKSYFTSTISEFSRFFQYMFLFDIAW